MFDVQRSAFSDRCSENPSFDTVTEPQADPRPGLDILVSATSLVYRPETIFVHVPTCSPLLEEIKEGTVSGNY